MSRAKSNSMNGQLGAQQDGMKEYKPVGYTKYGGFVSKDAPAQC